MSALDGINQQLNSMLASSTTSTSSASSASSETSTETTGTEATTTESSADSADISAKSNLANLAAQAQFELSIQIISKLLQAQGIDTSNISLSTMASVDGGSASESSSDLMSQLQEMYTPENTAERILNFALARYDASGEGDTAEARQAYADEIGAAIQKGFDEAQSILGDVDDTTQSGIDETYSLVFAGLEQFVETGATSSDSTDTSTYWQNLLDSISASKNSSTTTSYSATGSSTSTANSIVSVDA